MDLIEQMEQMQRELKAHQQQMNSLQSGKPAGALEDNPLGSNTEPKNSLIPPPMKLEEETDYEFQKRQYEITGVLPQSEMPQSESSGKTTVERSTQAGSISATWDALKFIFGPTPLKAEEFDKMNYFSDPTLAPLDKNSPVYADKAKKEKKKKTEKGGSVNYFSDPTLASMDKDSAYHDVDGKKIIGEGLYALSWVTSPLRAPTAMAISPMIHNYKSSNPISWLAEFADVSVSEGLKTAFPYYGQDETRYGYELAKKLFPEAPEWSLGMLGGSFDIIFDPLMVAGVALGTMTQIGTQSSRAMMRSGVAPKDSVLMHGLKEMITIGGIDEEFAVKLQSELKAAETATEEAKKAAIKAFSDTLNDPAVESWANRVKTQAWGDAQKLMDDAYRNSELNLWDEHYPRVVEEYTQRKVRERIDQYLEKLQNEGLPGDEYLKLEPEVIKMAEEDELAIPLSEFDHSEINRITSERVVKAKANQPNNLVTQMYEFASDEGKKEVWELIVTGQGHRIFKANLDNIHNGNFVSSMEALLQNFYDMYKELGGGKIGMDEITRKASKVRLENLLDSSVNNMWDEFQYLAAHSTIRSMYDETVRLALAGITVNSDPRYLDAFGMSLNYLSRLSGKMLAVEESWGRLGKVMQLVKGELAESIGHERDFLRRLAEMQETGMDKSLHEMANQLIHADKMGVGASLLAKVGRKALKGANILENSIYEQYVNALLSAIKTSKVNITSTAANVIVQPMDRMLTIFAGNRTAIQETGYMLEAMKEGTVDALIFYADTIAAAKMGKGLTKRATAKVIDRIIPEKAKAASRVRMSTMSNMYPPEYLDPNGYRFLGQQKYLHEIDKINSRKSISSLNWGWNPKGRMGKSLDAYGNFIRLPGQALKYEDLGFKFMGYNMGARVEAYRILKRKGKPFNRSDVDRLVYNSQLKGKDFKKVSKAGTKFADYVTFQKELGSLGKLFQKTAQSRFFRWYFPFFKTPVNLVKVGAERTPIGFYKVAKEALRGDTQAAQLTFSRMTSGTIIAMSVAGMIDPEKITGGYDMRSDYGRKMMSLERPQYSIKVGDIVLDMSNVEFWKSTVGLAANYRNAMAQLDFEDPADRTLADEIAATFVGPFAKMAFDQHWLSEIGRLMYYLTALRNGELDFGDAASAELGRKGASLIPYSSFLREFNHVFVDQEFRMAQGFLQEKDKVIPGRSFRLPAYRNLYGQKMMANEAFGPDMHHRLIEFILPIPIRKAHNDPVSKELSKVPVDIPPMIRSINGVRLSPREKSEIQRYSGIGVGSIPLQDELYRTINTPEYQLAQPNGKAKLLERVIHRYRSMAMRQIIEDSRVNDFSTNSLYNKVQEKKQWEVEQLLPINPRTDKFIQVQ